MTKPKAPKKKTGNKSGGGKLVPQPHGGALLQGGDHKRTGRPLDRIKALALSGFEAALPKLVDLAKGSTVLVNGEGEETDAHYVVKHTDQINAAKLLYDVGGGARIVQTDVQERLKETLAVIRQRCTPELAALILGDMDMIWRVPVHTQGET